MPKTTTIRSRSKSRQVIKVVASDRHRDPLQIQISARVTVPRGKTITANVIRQAIAYRIKEDADPPGIKLQIVQWRNAGPWRAGRPADWRSLAGPLLGWSESTVLDHSALRNRGRNRAR